MSPVHGRSNRKFPVFADRYATHGVVGEGGMATVYVGTDRLLRRRIAIKVLRPQLAVNETSVRRFYREANSTRDINHPNIVTTYDAGHEGDDYYIVREYVEGRSLAQIIETDGRLPEVLALEYAIQIATGLSFAHGMGLLHRDVKPGNVLVTTGGVAKISDFGIVRWEAQQTLAVTNSGQLLGSIYYMSPEQAQNKALTPASDLYSLGVMMYEMLTGSTPYSGDSLVSVALQHVNAPIPAIDPKLGVTAATRAIVENLLQKNAGDRFASAEQLLVALKAARVAPDLPTRVVTPPVTQGAVIIGTVPPLDAPSRPAAPKPPPEPAPRPEKRQAPLYAVQAAPEPSRPARWSADPSLWRTVIAAVVLLAIATVAGFALTATARSYTRVPDLNGIAETQARAILLASGFNVTERYQSSDLVRAHHVIRQTPVAGGWAKKGTNVVLVASSGAPSVSVPNVVGLDATHAKAVLLGSALSGAPSYQHAGSAAGNVLAQRPSPGAMVAPHGAVALVISEGPAPTPRPTATPHAVATRRAPTPAPVTVAAAPPPPKPAPRASAPPAAPPTTAGDSAFVVRSQGALHVYESPQCSGDNFGIAVDGFPGGCTDFSQATSGALRNGAGTGYIVPVTSSMDDGGVIYGLLYFRPAGSTSQWFLGLLPGDGSGHLIVRVQDGVFVEQNGNHVKYSSFDGKEMTLVSRNY